MHTTKNNQPHWCFRVFRLSNYSVGASRGIAKLAVAALAADAPPAGPGTGSGEAVEKNAPLGGGVGLDGITVATPVPGSSGGDGGDGGGPADAGGVGGVPGNSEEREAQDGGSQCSPGARWEDCGGDASVASNASSRASSRSLATLSRRASEAGVAVSKRVRDRGESVEQG